MRGPSVTRRQFTRVVGVGLGGWAVASGLARAGRAGAEPGPATPAARPDAAPGPGVVRLDANENPYGPSPKALEAMSGAHPLAARYPDRAEEEVTTALAALHGVAADNVLLGCGSGEVLRIAGGAFLGPGKNLVSAEPTFEAVLTYARVTSAEPVRIPLGADFRHDLRRMAGACDASTGLVYVCNPNNPTGTIVTKEELDGFFDRVPRSAVIVVDEAYHHFVEDPRYASAFAWWGKVPNLLVVRTFSKIHGLAGMRLGYGVGSMETIDAMRPYRTRDNANVAVLKAALAALEDSGHEARCRKELNGTRRWLFAEMTRVGRRCISSEANFVMIDLGSDVGPVIAALRERDVLVGRRFASMSSWLRVSIGTPEEMRRFVAALQEVHPARAARAA